MRGSPPVLSALLLSIFAGLFAQPAAALTVSLWSSYPGTLLTVADDNVGASTTQSVIPTSPPYGFTSSVTDGAASSAAQYSFSNSSFDITLTQARPIASSASSYADGHVYFSVDQSAAYLASGFFNAVDPDGRPTIYQSSLYDLTASSFLFDSSQDSRTTPHESFVLGGLGGDFANQFLGSLSGTLTPGHIYHLFYAASISTHTATTSAATANGEVHLVFTSVPEPGTGLLVGLGVATLALRRNSKRTRSV